MGVMTFRIRKNEFSINSMGVKESLLKGELAVLLSEGTDLMDKVEGEERSLLAIKIKNNLVGLKTEIRYELGIGRDSKRELQPDDFNEGKYYDQYIETHREKLSKRYGLDELLWLELMTDHLIESEGHISDNCYVMYYCIRGMFPEDFEALGSWSELLHHYWLEQNRTERDRFIFAWLNDNKSLAKEYFNTGRIPPTMPIDEYLGYTVKAYFSRWQKTQKT